MLNEINKIILHLSLIENVGPAVIENLMGLDHNNLCLLYKFSVAELMQVCRLSEQAAIRVSSGLKEQYRLAQELNLLEKNRNISLLTILDPEYPTLLKQTHLPPAVLYVIGNLTSHSRTVAMVGSRAADKYGQAAVKKLVPELVDAKWTIVSGGAIGIDTMVHQTTIESNGKTIAVLGAGLLKPYPSSNRKLFEQIVATGGALVSPFPLNFEALPGNFPARNRIISGLSRATIVVQAAEKSGASITAGFALEQGREVGAVPGAITNELSAGCNKLIAQGAAIITCAQDIKNLLAGVSPAYAEKENDLRKQLTIEQAQKLPENKSSDGKNAKMRESVNASVAVDIESRSEKNLNLAQTPQDKIMFLAATPISFNDILSEIEMDPQQLQELLFDLQLDEQIEQNHLGQWSIKLD